MPFSSLGSYQLVLRIKPLRSIGEIVFVPDTDGSSADEDLGINGFELSQYRTGLFISRLDAGTDGAFLRQIDILHNDTKHYRRSCIDALGGI